MTPPVPALVVCQHCGHDEYSHHLAHPHVRGVCTSSRKSGLMCGCNQWKPVPLKRHPGLPWHRGPMLEEVK